MIRLEHHVFFHGDSGMATKLDQILTTLLNFKQENQKHMSALDSKIADLQAAVAAETQVEQSAITLIQGIPAMIADAVTKAQEAGATAEELQALTDLANTITSKSSDLAAAVTQGTPAATV